MIKKLLSKLKISPIIKMIFSILSIVLFGVLCSAFVYEIGQNGKLEWSTFYKVKSFYGLLILVVIIFFYNCFTYKQDKSVFNFLDDSYCNAYFRSEAIPELVKKYKDEVRSGKIGKLEGYHVELKKILKQ